MNHNKEFPPIREILKAFQSEGFVQRGEDGPVDLEKTAAVHELAQADANNIRFVCSGCGQGAPLLESAMCVCGGFICEACQRVEEEGVCNHVLPSDGDIAAVMGDDDE